MKRFAYGLAAALACIVTVPASATVVYDNSPANGVGFNYYYSSSSNAASWIFQFSLSEETILTGMDIWSQEESLVSGVTIRIKDDDAGAPAADNLLLLSDVPLAYSPSGIFGAGSLAHVDFTGVDLVAGTYWIGMAGPDTGALAIAFIAGDPTDSQWLLNGDIRMADRGAVGYADYFFPFRLYGEPAGAAAPAVPEPATWATMLAGFGLVGAGLRRRTRAVARLA